MQRREALRPLDGLMLVLSVLALLSAILRHDNASLRRDATNSAQSQSSTAR